MATMVRTATTTTVAPAASGAGALKTEITLRGSVETVTEFFGYAVNTVLYQRGLYPPELFVPVGKYGLTLLVTRDDALKAYIGSVLRQLAAWLAGGKVQKLVLAITGVETRDVLERWVFNVETDKAVAAAAAGAGACLPRNKSMKEIAGEIQALMRQITASVTFLPLLDEACTFDLLVYTDEDAAVPATWEESDPLYIAHSTGVRLRAFSTSFHKVSAAVSYKVAHDESTAAAGADAAGRGGSGGLMAGAGDGL